MVNFHFIFQQNFCDVNKLFDVCPSDFHLDIVLEVEVIMQYEQKM